MNIQGLIERYEKFKASKKKLTSVDLVLKDLRSLDEPEPLPFKLKDVVGRIRGFDPMTQTRWLNGILRELGDDYALMKYRSGYEQGKFEGMVEREKVKVPQCVAYWIEKCKTFEHFVVSLSFALQPVVWEKNNLSDTCINWLTDANNQDIFARAWLDGYEVEEEKRYLVKIKATKHYIAKDGIGKIFFSLAYKESFTKKELEDAGFGWVFDCPGIEIEEVE